MKYQVQIWISTDGGEMNGHLVVDADSPEEAKSEAAEMIREATIDCGRPVPLEGWNAR